MKYARVVFTALLSVIAPEIAQATPLLNVTYNASGTGCTSSSAQIVCGDSIGTSAASAFAQPGHVGALGSGTSIAQFNSLQVIGVATASYFDTVIFTSSNPQDISVTVSMNVNLSGVLDSTSSGAASSILTMFVQSLVGDLRLSSNNGSAPVCSINFGARSCGLVNGVPLSLALTTTPIQIARIVRSPSDLHST
jgi:hypothetical protein